MTIDWRARAEAAEQERDQALARLQDAQDRENKKHVALDDAQASLDQALARCAALEQERKVGESYLRHLKQQLRDTRTFRAQKAEAALAVCREALREIADSIKWGMDTAIKRTIRDLQNTAAEALAATEPKAPQKNRYKSAETVTPEASDEKTVTEPKAAAAPPADFGRAFSADGECYRTIAKPPAEEAAAPAALTEAEYKDLLNAQDAEERERREPH